MKKADLPGNFKQNYIVTHADVMSRILFIFARLNPSVMYVQGMNEILATLYYCTWKSSQKFADCFESDLFFSFTMVMTDLRDGFLRCMDSEDFGINGKIRKFGQIFRQIDRELYDHIESCNVQPNFYCLRWLMLMMA